jgi:hypothetical protein
MLPRNFVGHVRDTVAVQHRSQSTATGISNSSHSVLFKISFNVWWVFIAVFLSLVQNLMHTRGCLNPVIQGHSDFSELRYVYVVVTFIIVIVNFYKLETIHFNLIC